MSATMGDRTESVAVQRRPPVARAVVAVALIAGAAGGVAVGMQAAPVPDVELMHLLRAMAVLKLAFVGAAFGAILWRLQAPTRPAWVAAYAVTCAAMAAGPALIWFSSHIILATILLHGGLAASLFLLWRDGATADLLRASVTRRRVKTIAASRPAG